MTPYFRIAVLTLLALYGAAAGAVERTVAYEDLHKLFARVADAGSGRFVHLNARLSVSDGSMAPGEIRMTIKSRGGDIAVPIDAEGHADFPVRDDLKQENPGVVVNVAKGKLSLNVDLDIDAPPAQRFRYGVMTEMLDEVDALIAKQGMLARMMGPDFEGLRIEFGPGVAAHAVVEGADGEERYGSDAQGRVLVPDRKDWRRENPYVQLSAVPLKVTLQPED